MPSAGYSDNKPHYWQAFRQNCHELLAMGYERLDPPSFCDTEEPAITGELVRSMKEVQELEDVPDWVIPLAVADDPPQNVEGRLGKKRRRIDIEFERGQRGPRPRFRFEAKRLHDSPSLRAYLGRDGLQLFVQGVYAPDDHEAGMLGYVQTETPTSWSRKLGQRLSSNSGAYRIPHDGHLQRVQLTDRIMNSHRSKHNRPSPNGPITIFHTFLLFC